MLDEEEHESVAVKRDTAKEKTIPHCPLEWKTEKEWGVKALKGPCLLYYCKEIGDW